MATRRWLVVHLSPLLLLLGVTAFVPPFRTHSHRRGTPYDSTKRREEEYRRLDRTLPSRVTLGNATCRLSHTPTPRPRRRLWFRRQNQSLASVGTREYTYDYHYDELVLGKNTTTRKTQVVLLIHPIGVGIGRWYYHRLLQSLQSQYSSTGLDRLVVLAPDLVGCGSASHPTVREKKGDNDTTQPVHRLPLLRVHDWSTQLLQLLQDYEQQHGQSDGILEWTLVSNGGCVPIALDMARRLVSNETTEPWMRPCNHLKHLILSAPPRVSGLLSSSDDEIRWEQSYRRLSSSFGVGRAFWWFALRRDGRFVQQFSSQNLFASDKGMGEEWTPRCVATARLHPLSRYSTFSFLAGTLQVNCQSSLEALKNRVNMSVITGGDQRANPARSWFWSKKTKPTTTVNVTRLPEVLQQNENGGQEFVVGGRRCPAQEDADGFCRALLSVLSNQ